MKLLFVSHTYVVDLNQQIIITIDERHSLDLGMVAPQSWKGEYGTQKFCLLADLNFPVFPLPIFMSGKISWYFFRANIKKCFEKFQPDIVFLHAEPWSLVALQVGRLCRRGGIRLVVFTNQNILKNYPPPFAWIEQYTYRKAGAIAVLSEEVRQVLTEKGYRGPTPELSYPCDLELFFPGQESELRTKLGITGVVVGFIGRLVAEKGLDTLVEATSQLMKILPNIDFTVLIVGSGEQESALKEQVDQTGFSDRFVFTGSVLHKEAPDYMRCFDIMVLPSRTTPAWKEQFGRTIVEALSCEIPVIGSDSGHIPYLIRETQGGSVFHEGDSTDLSEKLHPYIGDAALRRETGLRGSAVVRQKYSQEAVADQLYQIVDTVMNTQ